MPFLSKLYKSGENQQTTDYDLKKRRINLATDVPVENPRPSDDFLLKGQVRNQNIELPSNEIPANPGIMNRFMDLINNPVLLNSLMGPSGRVQLQNQAIDPALVLNQMKPQSGFLNRFFGNNTDPNLVANKKLRN